MKFLAIAVPCGKRQIFGKDFAKEWVGYAISLASMAIAKESLLGIANSKGSVNGPLKYSQRLSYSTNLFGIVVTCLALAKSFKLSL